VIATLRNLRPDTIREALRQAPWRRLVEAALGLILLIQVGRLVWLFLAPAPAVQMAEAAPAQPVDMGVLTRFDAFFRTGAASSLAGASGAEASQLRLFGVRAGGEGGGSAIIGPLGKVLAGPDFSGEVILHARIDPEEVTRAKFDFDATGHYARPDVFQLTVDTRAKQAVREV
jgi:hypothetical protein